MAAKRRTVEKARRYADGGGVTDPLAGMGPTELTKLRAELAARKTVTPAERRANLWQTAEEVAGVLPVIGNVLSARDAVQSGGDTATAVREGRWPAAAGNAALTGLAGLGAVLGLPTGRAAGAAAKDAGRTTRVFAGPTAKTADMKALKRAEAMRAAGADRADIWKKTGWFWGADGKPRFEISDEGARLENDRLIHPGYEAAYGDVPAVYQQHDLDTLGRYHPASDSHNAYITMRTGADVGGTHLHELQHHIQSIEGTAKGGSKGANDYRQLAGEVEARNVQARRNWDAKRRRDMAPWRTQDVPDERQIVRFEAGAQDSKLVNAETDDPVSGFRDFYYQREGKPDVYINGIHRADENPHQFWIEWIKGAEKNDLGPADMKAIIRGIKERYPDVTEIAGNRITGARKATGAKGVATLPVDKFARGGKTGRAVRRARGVHGAVRGSTGGREDARAVDVPAGSYVIPADVVAALGDGNSEAGQRLLTRRVGRARRATGGSVPVQLSDGEFVLPPSAVADMGGPDALDQLLLRTRHQYADNLKQLPGPRRG